MTTGSKPPYEDLTIWGVFLDSGYMQHIMPANKAGYTNHDKSKDCPCNPRPLMEQGKLIGWEHNPAS